MPGDKPILVHATTVAWKDQCVLIGGASGTGKSKLGLALMAFGCTLVADDQTALSRSQNRLIATCPPGLSGQIEARFIGILTATPAPSATVKLAIDLNQTESERIPPRRSINWLGINVPIIYKTPYADMAPAIVQLLKSGRTDV